MLTPGAMTSGFKIPNVMRFGPRLEKDATRGAEGEFTPTNVPINDHSNATGFSHSKSFFNVKIASGLTEHDFSGDFSSVKFSGVTVIAVGIAGVNHGNLVVAERFTGVQ
nr:hypothetical protein MA16_Dca028740 [Ipomoea trifida]